MEEETVPVLRLMRLEVVDCFHTGGKQISLVPYP